MIAPYITVSESLATGRSEALTRTLAFLLSTGVVPYGRDLTPEEMTREAANALLVVILDEREPSDRLVLGPKCMAAFMAAPTSMVVMPFENYRRLCRLALDTIEAAADKEDLIAAIKFAVHDADGTVRGLIPMNNLCFSVDRIIHEILDTTTAHRAQFVAGAKVMAYEDYDPRPLGGEMTIEAVTADGIVIEGDGGHMEYDLDGRRVGKAMHLKVVKAKGADHAVVSP